MTISFRLAALAAAAALGLACAAQAAEPASKPAAKTAKAPAKTAKAAKPAAPVEAPLPDADAEQVAAAERAYAGAYACEFNQSLDVLPNAKHPGYLDVKWKKDTFTMKPVLSSTGALRLEDVKGRTLMVQIANKSMLMDVKAGQRLVDECLCDQQREAVAQAKANGTAHVGALGIDPSKPLPVAVNTESAPR